MILLTGSSGLIGHRVAQFLQASDQDFICLDPLEKDNNENKMFCYQGMTSDRAILKKIFETHPVEQVIHLGMSSTAQEISNSYEQARDSIVNGTKNLIDVMLEHGTKKLLFASSSMVYGDFLNNQALETHPCVPKTEYGKLKREAEQLILEQDKLDYIIFRPTAVYGAADRKDRVVSKFLRLASEGKTIKVKGADNLLDFTHIDDVIQAIDLMLRNQGLSRTIYNIARGRSRSLHELIDIITQHFPNTHVEFLEHDESRPKRGTLNIEKAKNDFGFSPSIELEDGIKSMINGRPV